MITHLVIPDQHAHPDYHNERAFLIGHLIASIKPNVVINIGDGADMPSLSSYDKGTRGYEGRRYGHDIDAAVDFQDRLWDPVRRQKRKKPHRVYLIGNHEQRIEKATQTSPELHGTIGLSDLQLDSYYDTIVPYQGNTPGIINIDGVDYAHFFVSGVMGRPISGEHPATSLLTKRFASSTCGHLHLADYSIRTAGSDKKIMGCFTGMFMDYTPAYAGNVANLWWSGVIVKRFHNAGEYDVQFISIDTLRKAFKNV